MQRSKKSHIINIFLFAILGIPFATSQELDSLMYNSYYNSFTRDSVKIFISCPKDFELNPPAIIKNESEAENFFYYIIHICGRPFDNLYSGYITLTSYQQKIYLKYLQQVRSKYARWITEKAPLGKKLGRKKFKKYHGGGSIIMVAGNRYWATWNETLYECKVVENNGQKFNLLLIYSPEITACNMTGCIRSPGFILNFSSLDELDQFIDSISEETTHEILRPYRYKLNRN